MLDIINTRNKELMIRLHEDRIKRVAYKNFQDERHALEFIDSCCRSARATIVLLCDKHDLPSINAEVDKWIDFHLQRMKTVIACLNIVKKINCENTDHCSRIDNKPLLVDDCNKKVGTKLNNVISFPRKK